MIFHPIGCWGRWSPSIGADGRGGFYGIKLTALSAPTTSGLIFHLGRSKILIYGNFPLLGASLQAWRRWLFRYNRRMCEVYRNVGSTCIIDLWTYRQVDTFGPTQVFKEISNIFQMRQSYQPEAGRDEDSGRVVLTTLRATTWIWVCEANCKSTSQKARIAK